MTNLPQLLAELKALEAKATPELDSRKIDDYWELCNALPTLIAAIEEMAESLDRVCSCDGPPYSCGPCNMREKYGFEKGEG